MKSLSGNEVYCVKFYFQNCQKSNDLDKYELFFAKLAVRPLPLLQKLENAEKCWPWGSEIGSHYKLILKHAPYI